MRPNFNREHVRTKSVPGMLSCQEIRYWMAYLLDNGWTTNSLQEALGVYRRQAVWCKAKGKKWIYAHEQPRFSRQLKRILSGELVRGPGASVIVADDPKPLRLPGRMAVVDGRLRWLKAPELPKPSLRSFRDIFDNPGVLNGGSYR